MLNRIQKLLMTEYNDFEDTILIESSFAQVEENGHGLRAVQLGLTSNSFIIAQDVFNVDYSNIFYYDQSMDVDPEIETLELSSIIPLDCLTLRTYRKGFRLILKIVLCSGQIWFFEFGGMLLRNVVYHVLSLYWNVWRDRIRLIRSSKIKSFYTQEDLRDWEDVGGDDEGEEEEEVNEKTSLINTDQNREKRSNYKMPKLLKVFLKDYNKSNSSTSMRVLPAKSKSSAAISVVGSDISLWNDIKGNIIDLEVSQRKKMVKSLTNFFMGDKNKENKAQKDENWHNSNTDDGEEEHKEHIEMVTQPMAPYEKCYEYINNSEEPLPLSTEKTTLYDIFNE